MPQNCTKMLRNLTFVVKFAYLSIRPKKNFCFFERLLRNFLRDSGKHFGKSRATSGKPYPRCLNHAFLAGIEASRANKHKYKKIYLSRCHFGIRCMNSLKQSLSGCNLSQTNWDPPWKKDLHSDTRVACSQLASSKEEEMTTEIEFIHLLRGWFLTPFCLFFLYAAPTRKCARMSSEMAQFVLKIAHLATVFWWNQPDYWRRYPVTVSYPDYGSWSAVRLTAPLGIICCVYLLYRLVSHAHPCKTDSLLPIHLCSGIVVFY